MRTGANRRVALVLSGLVVLMIGLTALSVPLYRRFCQATGYGGATERAQQASGKVLSRTMNVRFDSSVNPMLPWRFKPSQGEMTLRIGETGIATFHAQNMGATPITGTATYNVQPDKIGRYFVKIQCFCFTEQHLDPGQSADLPVMFYIDPKIADDPDLDDVTTVTLSYTFFKSDSKAFDKAVDAYTKAEK